MSDDTTGKNSAPLSRTDWARLRRITEDELHAEVLADPEISPTDNAFWQDARVVRPASGATVRRSNAVALTFRTHIDFDPQNDDAIIWADEGDKHFRLSIRRSLLVRRYGLTKYFDHVGAKKIIEKHRPDFEKLGQDAYKAGASEIIIG